MRAEDRFIAAMESETDLSFEDAELAKQLLQHRGFRKYGRAILSEINGKQVQLTAANLTNPEGVHAALKVQGEISGMQRCLSIVFEVIEDIEDLEDSEKDEDNG